ncbi:MAG: diacylglycerol kinase [Moheibacter sp.]
MLRFLRSAKFALNGILYGLRTERNVQITVGVMVFTILIGFLLNISQTEMLIVLLWMFGIGAVEYINTSIEKLADRVTTDYDEQIKYVKDMSAGATFIVSIGAAISCLFILVPKIITLF